MISIKNTGRLIAALFVLTLPATSLQAQRDRITEKIERSRTVVLKGNVHPKARPRDDIGLVDPLFRVDYVTLVLKPSEGQQAALNQLLADQQELTSPKYHKWLTPEQYAERFGLSSGDIGKIVTWLRSDGFAINYAARGRNWVAFSGTAAQITATFHTEIHRYRVEGETHFANASEPAIPAALTDVVSGLTGLDDFRMQPQSATLRGQMHPNLTDFFGRHFLAPDDLATIYDIAPLHSAGIDGSGQNIVVVGQSDVDLSDIDLFRNGFNLPANDPQKVLVGPDPGTTDAATEADLDLEWVGAVAPNATITYVYAHGAEAAVAYSVDNNLAPVISSSFVAGCEDQTSFLGLVLVRLIAQQANAQGITWANSSGDAGPAGCDQSGAPQATQGLAVEFPASVPEVTGVGGTEFAEGNGTYWSFTNGPNSGTALSYIPETAWNDSSQLNSLHASGGGVSAIFSKPMWQTGPGVPDDGFRDVPDIALAASLHDGYFGYLGGKTVIYGGTSASAPVFAGMLALLNQYLVSNGNQAQPGLGNINPMLYRLARTGAGAFNDVTTGDNIVPCEQDSPDCSTGSIGYTAGPGYDLVTGLGSIDVNNLFAAWQNLVSTSAAPALSGLTSQSIVNAPSRAQPIVFASGTIFSLFGAH